MAAPLKVAATRKTVARTRGRENIKASGNTVAIAGNKEVNLEAITALTAVLAETVVVATGAVIVVAEAANEPVANARRAANAAVAANAPQEGSAAEAVNADLVASAVVAVALIAEIAGPAALTAAASHLTTAKPGICSDLFQAGTLRPRFFLVWIAFRSVAVRLIFGQVEMLSGGFPKRRHRCAPIPINSSQSGWGRA